MSESHLPELRDLTEKQVSEERRWRVISTAILEALPDAVVVADEGLKIVRINNQTQLIFGYHASELQGQPVEILLPEELRERHRQHTQRYIQEPRPRIMGGGLQLKGRRKDGSEFPADISLSPVMTTEGLFVVVVIRKTREVHAPAG